VARVVVGYDGSAHARRALERAAAVAEPGDEVIVLSAVTLTPPVGRGPGPAPIREEDRERQRAALQEAAELLAGRGLHVRPVEGIGDPAEAIVAEARESGADLIVVGTRGLGLAERITLGSVSSKVVHHAPCDVLVVR
jgi:nucleotide-binding universal stress UspA family protein